MTTERFVNFKSSPGQLEITGSGAWTADNAAQIGALIDDAHPDEASRLDVDMGGVGEFDTFGAWILERLTRGDGRPRSGVGCALARALSRPR